MHHGHVTPAIAAGLLTLKKRITCQMSDPLPIWIQVKTDIEGFRLNQIIQEAKNCVAN